MSSTPQFAHIDTKQPDGFYVQLEMVVTDDSTGGRFHGDRKAYVGVRARAKCLVVRNGVGTYINLESAGLWGIEKSSKPLYLAEVYSEECEDLRGLIAAMQNPIYE